jgi:single-strand DNA-binding protein
MVIGKLVQRSFETEGQKRTVVEIQVQHVGPDLQFATAEVAKSTAEASPAPAAAAG